MRILAIDSSGMVASIAIVDGDSLMAEYTIDYKKTHSQTLLPMIDQIKTVTDIEMSSLDAIAISNGPGSFTGLRIGSATAKGLALALDKPVIQVSTIDALAYNYYGTDKIVCPIMDARRSEVYTGLYEFTAKGADCFEYSMKTLLSPVPLHIDSLIEKINEVGRAVIFTGDGIPPYSQVISEKITVPYSFGTVAKNRQRASSVAALAMLELIAGNTVSADDSAPVYLRLSQAERELMEKNLNKI